MARYILYKDSLGHQLRFHITGDNLLFIDIGSVDDRQWGGHISLPKEDVSEIIKELHEFLIKMYNG